MKLFLKYFLITIILLCITACTSIKDPKLVSIDNVVMESSDDSYTVLIDIKLYNPNMFPLRSKDVKLELFIDSLFIGKILLMNDFYIKKRDTLSLKTKLIIDYKLFKQPVNLNDTLNLRVKGSAKVSIFSINYKFDIEHQLRLSDLMEPLLKNNLKESDVNFRAITVKNIRLSTVDIVSTLTFKNNFNFDYTIEKLNIEIFDSNTYTNLVGQSSIGNPIQVVQKSNIDIESAISLNTAKLGKSILKNLFRRRYSLFIRANAVIVFNQIQVPITILKQVDYNPITQEVNIK
jgi:LEA14-like dessication related protein|tara:strand:+ start:1998 stop:2867 length:870 start_codon:yes stop_codon:yes gene_type:complete